MVGIRLQKYGLEREVGSGWVAKTATVIHITQVTGHASAAAAVVVVLTPTGSKQQERNQSGVFSSSASGGGPS